MSSRESCCRPLSSQPPFRRPSPSTCIPDHSIHARTRLLSVQRSTPAVVLPNQPRFRLSLSISAQRSAFNFSTSQRPTFLGAQRSPIHSVLIFNARLFMKGIEGDFDSVSNAHKR